MYALGVTQEGLKQWEDAGKTYDDFLKKYGNHRYASEVIMRRGETLFAQQLYQPAAEWLAAAAARPGFESADYATMRQAVALAKLGKQAEAGDLLAGIFTKFPNSTRFPLVLKTGHALARGLIRDNHPAEAVALVEKLLPHAQDGQDGEEEMPHWRWTGPTRRPAIPARRAESVGLYAAVGEQVSQEMPLPPQALYLAAYGALTQGDYAAALQYTDAFLSAYPKHELVPDVRFVAAESRLLLGKYDEAEKLYAELLREVSTARRRRKLAGTAGHGAATCRRSMPRSSPSCSPVAAQIKNADARAEAFFLVGNESCGAEAVWHGGTCIAGRAGRRAQLAAGRRNTAAPGAMPSISRETRGQGRGDDGAAGCRVPREQVPRPGPFPPWRICRRGKRPQASGGRVSPRHRQMARQFAGAQRLARPWLGDVRSERLRCGGRGVQHAGGKVSRRAA